MKKYAKTLLHSAFVLALGLGTLSTASAEPGNGAQRGREARGPSFLPPGHGGTPPGQSGNEVRGAELAPGDVLICGTARSEIDGPEGQAGKSHVAHVNFGPIVAETGEDSDAESWARMMYFWIGSELSFVFNGHDLEPGTDWTLVANIEGEAGTEGVCLGDGSVNPGGQLHITGSVDPGGNIPPDFNPFPEAGEEQPDDVVLQLVPSDSIDCATGLPAVQLPADAVVLESEAGLRFVDTDEIVCPTE